MEFNVAQLLKENIGAVRSYDVDERNVDLDYVNPAATVTGQLKLTRIPRGVLVRGNLSTSARVSCSRCISDMDEPLSIELDEEFFPTVDVWSGKAVPRDEDVDPDAPLIDENHVLDLTDVVRQSAQVGMEMHPLCRPDCKGLCSECGANLNDEPDHSHAVLDESPFAALRQLNLN